MAADTDHAQTDHQASTASAPEVPEPHKLLGVLADTAKLRVFAALVLAPAEGIAAEDLAAAAGVSRDEAERAQERLCAVGLARATALGYAASPGVVRESLGALAKRREQQAAKAFATEDPAKLSVLLNSFKDGRLAHLPEKWEKREIVLEEIAQRFEPGTRYAEAEVNLVLRELYPDYAALRRYLVDSTLLTRAEGFYWRSGGTVRV
jgi:hypothetical protein